MKRKKMRHGVGLGFGAWLLLFVVSVLTAAVASEAELDQGRDAAAPDLKDLHSPIIDQKDDCNYTIIIETTCLKGAGTLDRVSLRFGDSSSNDILVRHLSTKHTKRIDGPEPAILDDVPRKPFQDCATDAFRVRRKCIQSHICYLYLKQRGDDDWRPGRAQVFVPGAPQLSSGSFYFRRFLPRHVWHGFDACSAEITPFGIRRPRRVFANKDGSESP